MSLELSNLCASFCALAGIVPPVLNEQNGGVVGFNIHHRSVDLDLVTLCGDDPGHAFVVFHMGSPDPAQPDYPRILDALLQANFVSLAVNQPVFGCHPETRGVTMQWVIPLSDTSAEDLHRLIEQGLDLVLQWRRTHFLVPAHPESAAPADSTTAYA